MNKTWQLRVCAMYLTVGIPLAASCAREANTHDDDSMNNGGSSQAGTTAKAGTGSGKAGSTGAFGGTSGKAGSSAGGNAGKGGEAMADGGDATPTAGTSMGGTSGAGGSGGVPADVLARASAIVYYQTSQTMESGGTIQMTLHIVNQSVDPLPMADVKVRYWLSAEAVPTLHVYYAAPQVNTLELTFVDAGDDSHALLTFSAGSITKGGDKNASQMELALTNYVTSFNQANDHSWQPTSSTSTPNGNITLYLQDKLIWGCEPSGKCFDDETGVGGAGAGGASDGGMSGAGAPGAAGMSGTGGAPADGGAGGAPAEAGAGGARAEAGAGGAP